MLSHLPSMSVLAFLVIVGFTCQMLGAQDLPVYTTVKLPDGSTEPVYQLQPDQPATFEGPEMSVERWKHYRWCTWDRWWFALPIETTGYYVIYGAVRKFEPGEVRFYEQRTVLGVYDRLEDITQHGMRCSDVVKFPLDRKGPDIYIFRAEPGQVWATQLLRSGPLPTNTYTIGAAKAPLLTANNAHVGQLSEEFPVALFKLDTQAGANYDLTVTADTDLDIYLLKASRSTAVRVAASEAGVMLTDQTPTVFCWTAVPRAKYLVMIMLKPGDEGSYNITLTENVVVGPPTNEDSAEIIFTGSSTPGKQYGWSVIQDDDGEEDARGGEVFSPDWSLYKELVLAQDPAYIKTAVLQYKIGCEPYDERTGLHLNWPQHPPATKRWPDLEVYVNDVQVLKGPLDEVAVRGWYSLRIDPNVLRRGVNVIRFTEEPGGADSFYIALDLGTDHDRSYLKYKGAIVAEELGPGRRTAAQVGGHGEYMIRLRYLSKTDG